MIRYILLFIGLALGQNNNIEERDEKDLSFIILESGDSAKVNQFTADFEFQPLIKFNLFFAGLDTTKYDVNDVRNVYKSNGKKVVNKHLFSMLKILKWSCNTFLNMGLFYLLIF